MEDIVPIMQIQANDVYRDWDIPSNTVIELAQAAGRNATVHVERLTGQHMKYKAATFQAYFLMAYYLAAGVKNVRVLIVN